MTKHERLLKEFEDVRFTLLMEGVARKEGERLEALNKMLPGDPGSGGAGESGQAVPGVHRPPFHQGAASVRTAKGREGSTAGGGHHGDFRASVYDSVCYFRGFPSSNAEPRACLIIGDMPNSEEFFCKTKQIFAGILTDGKKI